MGKVEDYWEDVTVYYVEFKSLNREQELSTHRRTLIFRTSISPSAVKKVVKGSFSNIIEVTEVDELTEALFFKSQ